MHMHIQCVYYHAHSLGDCRVADNMYVYTSEPSKVNVHVYVLSRRTKIWILKQEWEYT